MYLIFIHVGIWVCMYSVCDILKYYMIAVTLELEVQEVDILLSWRLATEETSATVANVLNH